MFQACDYYDDRHGIGTREALTKDTDYTCTTDGYFRIWCSKADKHYAAGYVDGENLMVVATEPNSQLNVSGPMAAIFVKKGSVLKYMADSSVLTECNGYFYPLA